MQVLKYALKIKNYPEQMLVCTSHKFPCGSIIPNRSEISPITEAAVIAGVSSVFPLRGHCEISFSFDIIKPTFIACTLNQVVLAKSLMSLSC